MIRFSVSLIAALLLAACSSIPFLSGEISMTADELTQKMARRFPIERSVGGLLDVTLSRPRVEANPAEQRITASFEVNVKPALSNRSVTGSLRISGRPEYVASSQSLFLRDATVDLIRMENMPEAFSAALAKAATNFAKDSVEDKALYTFKPEDLSRYGARYEPERIEVRTNAIVLKLK
ncbi:MAG: DUF1439 domain-containing protein [Betaproteobacteria bacterium]